MQVSEVMHKGITTVQINDTIKHVASIMKKEDIGSVPVYKNERPVGFVTDRDIVVSCVSRGAPPDETVSNAMTPQIFSVHENQDVTEASRIMRENQVSRLLVLDKGERPVGMVSLHDLSRKMNDTGIEGSIVDEVKR